jgi:hypothetical protein
MAVDYFHRVIVTGPLRQIDQLRRGLVHTTSRRVERRAWKERVPFSFAALYAIAPGARRVFRNVPYDPYDVSAWPVVRLNRVRAEIRYQLHTRRIELVGLTRALSRMFPRLTFQLLTHCVDFDEIVAFRLRNGKVRRRCLPASRHEIHWDRARKKFNLAGDDVYEDDAARVFAEDGMRDDALDHWKQPRRSSRKVRRRQWWNRPVVRDIETEQEIALIELNEELRTRPAKEATPLH